LIDPVDELILLPFIGPVTVWHLAKNFGLITAKPDRHLARISNALGSSGADELRHVVAEQTGVL